MTEITLQDSPGTAPQETAARPVDRAGLSIVVPAFNEEHSMARVARDLREALAGTNGPHEILVVDDGSTDGTAARAREAGVRVLQHAANRGYGAALKTGIRHARYGVVGMVDADGTYPVRRLRELVVRLAESGADMVVGARVGASVAIPPLRRPAKWMLNRLAEAVCGQRIPDLNSGLRVMDRETALQFFGLLADGFSFTTTITLAMLANGYLVEYVPIDYHRRLGRSKIRPLRDAVGFLNLVLRVALYFAPLKIFLPLSGALILLALAWALGTKLVLGELADVSTIVIAMTGVQVAVVGLLAELINRRVPNHYHSEADGRRHRR